MDTRRRAQIASIPIHVKVEMRSLSNWAGLVFMIPLCVISTLVGVGRNLLEFGRGNSGTGVPAPGTSDNCRQVGACRTPTQKAFGTRAICNEPGRVAFPARALPLPHAAAADLLNHRDDLFDRESFARPQVQCRA